MICPSQAPVGRHKRLAFTLLEVILALGLAVVVLGLIGVAANTILKTTDHGRKKTERDQLARAILHRIAEDLRGTIRYEPFDQSGLSSARSSATAAARALEEAAGDTGQDESGSTTETTTDSSAAGDTMLAGGGAAIPGLYGSQYALQLDVGRIPRLDEFMVTAEGMMVPTSDVRRVTYTMAGAYGTIPAGDGSYLDVGSMVAASGLVRRDVDQATAEWAAGQGGAALLDEFSHVLAPEAVALEFQYFDGTQWLLEWDSTAMGGLPRAVEILLVLSAEPTAAQMMPLASQPASMLAIEDPESVYRLIVHLPASDPIASAAQGAAPTAPEADSGATEGGNAPREAVGP